MPAPFTPLRVHSHGSLLHGIASPETLIRRALELGFESLALTDRDNLYLAVRFYQAAHSEGLRPLLGCVLTAHDREALLIAIDRRLRADVRAITARMLDERFDLVQTLAASPEGSPASGLHVVVEFTGLAVVPRAPVPPAHGVTRPAPTHGGGLWIGVRGLPCERPRLAERVAAARSLGVPLLATGDCTMLEAAEHDAHRAAVTAAAGELLERMPASAFCAPEAWLAPPAQWDRRVRAIAAGAGVNEAAEEALANNRLAAARCRLELELGRPIFPRAPLPDGVSGAVHLGRQGARASSAVTTARTSANARSRGSSTSSG
jgi:DNA polymerase-3 subunit alpha